MLELNVKLARDHFDLAATAKIDSPLTALFGPRDAGKSTLLGMLAGAVNPQQGWIKFGGETLFDTRRGIRVPAHRRRIGLVEHDPIVRPRSPGLAHLRSAQLKAQYPVTPAQFDEVIDLLELAPLLDAEMSAMSADDRQRIAVAQTLMASPRLLLLDDEPSRPDSPAASTILPFLTRLREALKLPIIYVSKSLNDIVTLTDQMVLMANGRILGVGDVHEILADRILLAATALQGIENVLPATVLAHETGDGCTVASYYGTELVLPIAPALAKGASVHIAIRSSDIALSRQYLSGTSIQNQIKGRICAIIRTAEHALVQVDCGSTLLAGISLRAMKQMDLQEGDTVYCLMKAHAFSYINSLAPQEHPNEHLH